MNNSHHGDTETRRKSENWIQNGWNVFCNTLKEIFDEGAYGRFLERTCSSRSRESYREFMHERETASPQKPRC